MSDENFTFQRQELGVGLGPDEARLSVAYVQLKDVANNVVDTSGERQQVTTAATLEIFDEWTLQGDWRQDLSGGGTISYGASLVYENECIAITGSGERRFTDDIGVNPETIFFVTVQLKTLG